MALRIVIDINDEDQAVLENDLVDVDAWVRAAVKGKINNCSKRMTRDAIQALTADPDITTMPATDEELRKAFRSRPGYKKRAERD